MLLKALKDKPRKLVLCSEVKTDQKGPIPVQICVPLATGENSWAHFHNVL